MEWPNAQWLRMLHGNDRNAALAELRSILLAGLDAGLRRGSRSPAVADLEDFVQEALIRITANLSSFRGDSHFTTWANRIAVRVAFSEMRRKYWNEVSLDAILETDGLLSAEPVADDGISQPDRLVGDRMLEHLLARIIRQDLSERQRQALTAVIAGMPIEEVARRMQTNRNALYKLLHDARKRIRMALEREGVVEEELRARL